MNWLDFELGGRMAGGERNATTQRRHHDLGNRSCAEFESLRLIDGVNQMKLPHVVVSAALLLCVCGVDRASAQGDDPRVEVGAHAAILRLQGSNGGNSTLNAGIGGRLSFEIAKWTAIEGEVNFFPRDKVAGVESMTILGGFRLAEYRRRTDMLAGLRIGARGERLGVFLKARPGITYVAHQKRTCEGAGCALVLPAPILDKSRTEFAFDVGGGVEFQTRGRAVARAEIGDTIIRHGNEAPSWLPRTSRTSHNLSSRFGVGFRF